MHPGRGLGHPKQPKLVPGGVKWGTKGSQEGPKEAKRDPKVLPRATLGPKMAPLGSLFCENPSK